MLPPVKLYWLKKKDDDLLIVASVSSAAAARLLRVHTKTLRRDGGVWSPQTVNKMEIDERAFAMAMQEIDTVFRYKAGWAKCSKLNDGKRAPAARHNSPTPTDDPVPMPRLITLSHEYARMFEAAGGAAWLRKAVEDAKDSDAVRPTRVMGESERQFSVRMSNKLWHRLQSLGGKTWIRHMIYKAHNEHYPSKSRPNASQKASQD